MSTKSILVISDDPLNASGFGTVIRNLFGNLNKKYKDKLSITAIAIYPSKSLEGRVIDVITPIEGDTYGVATFQALRNTYKYDIVFLLGDWWYWNTNILSTEWRKSNGISEKIVYYVPLDGVPYDASQIEAYKGADALIAMSPFGLDILSEYGCTNYIPHGYDPKIYYPRADHRGDNKIYSSENRYIVGCVGRNARRKNIWAIIKAVQMLNEQDDSYGLFIHTPTNDNISGDLRQYVKFLKMEDVVEFTDGQKIAWPNIEGYKDEDMYNEVYSQMDCLVSAGREGFGLPILEAAACGIPLVLPLYSAPQSLNYPHSLTYSAGQLKPDSSGVLDMHIDVYALHKAIKTCRDKYFIKLKPTMSKFTWDNVTNQFYQFFKELDINKSIEVIETEELNKFVEIYGSNKKIVIEKSILVIMPESHGDVLLVTATLNSLKLKYPEYHLVFCTKKKFFEIVEECPWIDELIEYNQKLHMNYSLLHRKYEMVFTPFFDTQLTANWVHGGHGRGLAEVYANNCVVKVGEYYVPSFPKKKLTNERKSMTIHCGSGVGDQYARKYDYWNDVVDLIKTECKDLEIIQIGTKDDMRIANTTDARNKTSVRNMYSLIQKSICHIGIDSFPMHAAAILKTNSIIIWGNTFSQCTGPSGNLQDYMLNLEPEVRPDECPRPCHKVNCEYCKSALNTINPETIASQAIEFYNIITRKES